MRRGEGVEKRTTRDKENRKAQGLVTSDNHWQRPVARRRATVEKEEERGSSGGGERERSGLAGRW